MTFPDDCLQSVIGSEHWWKKVNNPSKVQRGDLIYAFLPHVDQVPYAFYPVGREIPTEHSRALVKVEPININAKLQQVDLPVAAMPRYVHEVWGAYRAKRRPCIVLSVESQLVDKSLTRGKANHSTAPTYIVAPYYGVNVGKRSGYSDLFTERVRHCEYPQFHWDKLPIPGATESILRLDHIMPIGNHYQSYKHTGYRLSKEALEIIDDLLMWNLKGGVPQDSVIITYREIVEDCFAV